MNNDRATLLIFTDFPCLPMRRQYEAFDCAAVIGVAAACRWTEPATAGSPGEFFYWGGVSVGPLCCTAAPPEATGRMPDRRRGAGWNRSDRRRSAGGQAGERRRQAGGRQGAQVASRAGRRAGRQALASRRCDGAGGKRDGLLGDGERPARECAAPRMQAPAATLSGPRSSTLSSCTHACTHALHHTTETAQRCGFRPSLVIQVQHRMTLSAARAPTPHPNPPPGGEMGQRCNTWP